MFDLNTLDLINETAVTLRLRGKPERGALCPQAQREVRRALELKEHMQKAGYFLPGGGVIFRDGQSYH